MSRLIRTKLKRPKEIVFEEIERPKARKNEALLEIKRVGICGSDIDAYRGRHPYISYPVVQGHEISAKVSETGGGVGELREGDHVVLRPQVACGRCFQCKQGNYHICESLKVMGFQTAGCASEYVAVDGKNLLKISKEISYDYGALVEPIAVAVHSLGRLEQVEGANLIVMGAGPIGNLVAQVARGLGVSKVAITDISDYRLGIAEECGIDLHINPEKENLGKRIEESFAQGKADAIIECVGNEQAIGQAISNARKGSEIIVVGVYPKKVEVDIGLVQDRELEVKGSLMYKEEDFRTAIGLVEEGRLSLENLVTKKFGFEEFDKAYQFIEEREAEKDYMRILVTLED